MSTFGGKIQEIPEISVDRFDKENVNSEAYFLSHCHSDHMIGLSDYHFQDHVVENCKNLYASEISCVILGKMHPYIKENLKVLSMYSPTTVHLKEYAFSVTPIPAGHCPGSLMFLFEGEKCVLYTGDYRINKNDISKFKPFYDDLGRRKAIDKIYLDTTFFSKKYPYFPRRIESLRELCKIVKEWIGRGEKFIINLDTSAWYGYEYLFREIWKETKMPIHVTQNIYDFYVLIPELDKAVTVDGSATQIHCKCISYRATCDAKLNSNVKSIRISAFSWTEEHLKEGISKWDYTVNPSICYSTHASYEEGVHFIKFLRPKEIEACVKHNDPIFNEEMLELIEDLLKGIKTEKVEKTSPPKLFNVEELGNRKLKRAYDKSHDYLNILDSPPRQKNMDVEEYSTLNKIVSPVKYIEIAHLDEVSTEAIIYNEHSVILDILELSPKSQDAGEVEPIILKRSLTDSKDGENSILLDIINSKSSSIEISDANIEKSEEDSVIYSIIDSPPHKIKK